jgi:CIC family chloride channel protein
MSQGKPASDRGNLLTLAVASLVAGAVAGLAGALFRLCLDRANQLREAIISWAVGCGAVGYVVVVVACAAAAAGAAWLVRRFSPHAAGSGIPHVEAVLSERLPPAPLGLVPVKFVGGVLAMGAGLALGREGPSVQIGASLAQLVGKFFRRNWNDLRVLMAVGAGAGLATAFNAPIAGAVFVLEELVRRFETRMAIAALGASAIAMTVARMFLGESPEFQLVALPYSGSRAAIQFGALGILTGVAGIAYNRAILGAIGAAAKLSTWPVEVRAAAVAAAVGLLACIAPEVVGGGETLAQQTLSGGFGVRWLVVLLLLRFALGPISYATRTPGGLFAPVLAVGTLLGLIFAAACQAMFVGGELPANAYAVVGMAAFFTAVVRAPITGIALIVEMTGNSTLLLPMLGASFLAMLVPTLAGELPIYESLREDAPHLETEAS